MKKNLITCLFVILMLTILVACKDRDSVYAVQLKAEKALIAEYIKRNGYEILDAWPQDSVFKDNQYVLTSTGLYVQLIDKGLATDTIEVAYNDVVVMRYKKYGLGQYADTISYWTTAETPYPLEFNYAVTSDDACSAWHEAVSYMKKRHAHAKLICTSKLGFSDDSSSVLTPYGYELKITGIKK